MSNGRYDDAIPTTLFSRLLELLSDSFIYGLSTLLTQLAGFLLLPLYTRYLSPADYGVTAMLNVVTMIFAPLGCLCLTSGAYRRLNLQADETTRGTVLSTVFVGAALIACIFFAVGWATAEWTALWLVGDVVQAPLVRWTMLAGVFVILGDVARIDLRNRRQARTVGALNLAAFLATVLLTIRFVVFDRLGVRGVVLGSLCGTIFGTCAALWVIRRRFPRQWDYDEFRRMLKYGLPLVPHRLVTVGLMMYSQYAVRSMLGAGGLNEAGLFDMAARFALPLGMVINAIQEAWLPYKFQVHARDERPDVFFRESFTYYLALVLFIWVGIAAWGPEALRLVTAPQFHAAASLIALTALARLAWGIYMMMGSGIELSDDTRPYSLISLTGLVVVVSTTQIVVPHYGAAGAALANACGFLAMAVMAQRLARTRLKIQYDWPRVGALTATACACVALTYLSWGSSPALRIATAVVATLVFPIFALRILRRRHVAAAAWTSEPLETIP